MKRFVIPDIHQLEKSPTSAGTMRNKLSAMIDSSVMCPSVKVDSLNTETGEYRIVLQGTLDKDHIW
jgi:type II secretory pathway component PulM